MTNENYVNSIDETTTNSGIGFTIQPVKSSVRICGTKECGVIISIPEKAPNWWFRLWQKILLGFIWEVINEEEEEACTVCVTAAAEREK